MNKQLNKLGLKLGSLCVLLHAKASSAFTLPTSSKYTTSDGDYSAVFGDMFTDNYEVGVGIFGAIVFLLTCYAAIAAFMEYRKGQKELGDVGMIVGFGFLIVSLCFYYLNEGQSVVG
jgi:hypothetical protein